MPDDRLGLGIVGAGVAGTAMARSACGHPGVHVVAVADPSAEARSAFCESTRDVVAVASVEELCRRVDVEAVYVASPSSFHAPHAIQAVRAGKHVVVEKPMAVDLAEATAMVDASEQTGATLMVGHSHSYEPAIDAMRGLVVSGDIGRLRSIVAVNFTDWLFRPRRPDELDRDRGGGVVLRQGSHHVDAARYIAGGRARSVRATVGAWDPERPFDGAYHALLTFDDGIVATLVYSGHDHFSTTELTFGVGESGLAVQGEHASARRQLAALEDEVAARSAAGGSRQHELMVPGPHPSVFGLIIVSCERADIRVGPTGLIVYDDRSRHELPLEDRRDGRARLLDELVGACRGGTALHDAGWGRANLEVCLAMHRSSEEGREVLLEHQVPLAEAEPTQ